jgi:hypothetical protein
MGPDEAFSTTVFNWHSSKPAAVGADSGSD